MSQEGYLGHLLASSVWSCSDSTDFRMGCPCVSVRHPGRKLIDEAISEVCAVAVS